MLLRSVCENRRAGWERLAICRWGEDSAIEARLVCEEDARKGENPNHSPLERTRKRGQQLNISTQSGRQREKADDAVPTREHRRHVSSLKDNNCTLTPGGT